MEQVVNTLEVLSLLALVIGRLIASCYIVKLLCEADFSSGWKIFLIAMTIIIGMGFSVKYHNPNDPISPSDLEKSEAIVEQFK